MLPTSTSTTWRSPLHHVSDRTGDCRGRDLKEAEYPTAWGSSLDSMYHATPQHSTRTTLWGEVDATATAVGADAIDWFGLYDEELNLVFSRVVGLLEEEEDEEAKEYQPSLDTVLATLQLLYEARPFVHGAFPRASASTDSEGSVYVFWKRPDLSIQLTVPVDESRPTFIYYRNGDRSGVEHNVLAERLADWLNWFADA